MKTYRTSEIAGKIGIHRNTVLFYEEMKLIPAAERQQNRYRIFTERHLDHLKLTRLVLKSELLQNGLRKKAIEILHIAAAGAYEEACHQSQIYRKMIEAEKANVQEALIYARNILGNDPAAYPVLRLSRQQTADLLDVTIDTLRNWERNGLLTVARKENGYRVYNEEDIQELKMIKALRCGNFSLAAILRMMNRLRENREVNIEAALNTPEESEDIISECDRLLTSLAVAESDSRNIQAVLEEMEKKWSEV